MSQPRSHFLSLGLLIAVSAPAACSVDAASNLRQSECSGLGCSSQSATEDVSRDSELDYRGLLAETDSSETVEPPAKVACGLGSCVPDDVTACGEVAGDVGEEVQSKSADDAPTPPASQERDAGVSGSSDAGGASDAGHVSDAGSLSVRGADAAALTLSVDGSFVRPETPTPEAATYACRLSSAGGTMVRECAASGARGVEESCTSSADCLPGLGCVGVALAGRCLPYCCALDAACGEGFYCAERPLRSESLGETAGPLVPVCDRSDDCSLGEPFPCEGPDCVCGAETACTLVKPDGTTACLPPGTGQAGDPCSLPGAEPQNGEAPTTTRCSVHHHCSQATDQGTCVRTCEIDEPGSATCAPGVCQASPALPMGWGICVGATPDEMNAER